MKAPGPEAAMVAKSRRRKPDPLEVRMTLSFRFGDEAEDSVTVMNDRKLPMVGSVFQSRDRIVRAFAVLLVRTGMAQPKVLREIVPALNLLRRLRPSAAAKRKARGEPAGKK
jgi:hypothetical protein